MDKMPTIKRAIIEISPQFLARLFINSEEKTVKVSNGLPEDANYVGINVDPHKQSLILCFESEEFTETPFGENLPRINPLFEIINK